jgi:hypothetical protein
LHVLELVFEDNIEHRGIDIIELRQCFRRKLYIIALKLLTVQTSLQTFQFVVYILYWFLAVLLDWINALAQWLFKLFLFQLCFLYFWNEFARQHHLTHLVLKNTSHHGASNRVLAKRFFFWLIKYRDLGLYFTTVIVFVRTIWHNWHALSYWLKKTISWWFYIMERLQL